jgi:hypothetical protein
VQAVRVQSDWIQEKGLKTRLFIPTELLLVSPSSGSNAKILGLYEAQGMHWRFARIETGAEQQISR